MSQGIPTGSVHSDPTFIPPPASPAPQAAPGVLTSADGTVRQVENGVPQPGRIPVAGADDIPPPAAPPPQQEPAPRRHHHRHHHHHRGATMGAPAPSASESAAAAPPRAGSRASGASVVGPFLAGTPSPHLNVCAAATPLRSASRASNASGMAAAGTWSVSSSEATPELVSIAMPHGELHPDLPGALLMFCKAACELVSGSPTQSPHLLWWNAEFDATKLFKLVENDPECFSAMWAACMEAQRLRPTGSDVAFGPNGIVTGYLAIEHFLRMEYVPTDDPKQPKKEVSEDFVAFREAFRTRVLPGIHAFATSVIAQTYAGVVTTALHRPQTIPPQEPSLSRLEIIAQQAVNTCITLTERVFHRLARLAPDGISLQMLRPWADEILVEAFQYCLLPTLVQSVETHYIDDWDHRVYRDRLNAVLDQPENQGAVARALTYFTGTITEMLARGQSADHPFSDDDKQKVAKVLDTMHDSLVRCCAEELGNHATVQFQRMDSYEYPEGITMAETAKFADQMLRKYEGDEMNKAILVNALGLLTKLKLAPESITPAVIHSYVAAGLFKQIQAIRGQLRAALRQQYPCSAEELSAVLGPRSFNPVRDLLDRVVYMLAHMRVQLSNQGFQQAFDQRLAGLQTLAAITEQTQPETRPYLEALQRHLALVPEKAGQLSEAAARQQADLARQRAMATSEETRKGKEHRHHDKCSVQ